MTGAVILSLGPARMPDFMTGAFFLSILAWPTAEEGVTFDRVSEELAAGVIRASKAGDPNLAQSLIDRWPDFHWSSIVARARKRRPALAGLNHRLEQRMAAARAAIGKAHEQLFGTPVVLPPTMTATSLDQLCRLIARDTRIADPENVERLVWRKSLPIIHLAMATQLMLVERHPESNSIHLDLQDIEFCRTTVHIAGLLEAVVLGHPGFAITPERLTRVRWFE